MQFFSLSESHIPILLAFSVYTNGKKLFSMKKSKSYDVMHCVNGIRVLSIVWVIFSHSYLTFILSNVINLAYAQDVSNVI